jgi:hypothetical protein
MSTLDPGHPLQLVTRRSGRPLRDVTTGYVARASRCYGGDPLPFSRGVMSVVRQMSLALACTATPRELRDALLWVFVQGLAESEGRSGLWWAGVSAVIGDLELALLGWGEEHVADRWAAQAFLAAAESLSEWAVDECVQCHR